MVVELSEKEMDFLKKLLKAVNLPGVDMARRAVSIAQKIGMQDDPDGD